MALKKSQLFASIWESCNELGRGIDTSKYKDYILTLLFMKYVTDKYAGNSFGVLEVPDGGSFHDMVALKGDKEIGDKINKIISKLAESNQLKGVIDQADFNDENQLGAGKDMQDRLSKLISIFENLDLGANRIEGDDLLGDAYEYLMRHFASEAGKSKGQFYTPAEVSTVIAKVIGIDSDTRQDQTVYDPTCGSGSLLLKAAAEAPHGITIYGQENDNATWSLAKMNMILHDYPTAELWQGNTLSSPYFKNPDGSMATFDFAVANPPFSAKAWSNGFDPANDEFGRFEWGVPPEKNGDYAFLLHLIKSLKSKGKGAIILPHGVLFRGHKEAEIRKKLIQRGFIKGIIGMPANLFYGTGIPACILVIDKEEAANREGIFMVDASRGYMKDGNKNRLRSQDIHKIVDVFNKQTELTGYSRWVPIDEIADTANAYNLNIPRYIDASEPVDHQDLYAHLKGGIPQSDVDALEEYWQVFPSLKATLFKDNGRPGYVAPALDPDEVKPTILEHSEFQSFADQVKGIVTQWQEAHRQLLWNLHAQTAPKEVIRTLSEDLISRFKEAPLLNRYDLYQQLMDYWAEVMQDDVYLVVAEGWQQAAQPRPIIKDKMRKIEENADLTVNKQKFKMDLIPPELIINRYFSEEQKKLDELALQWETATQKRSDFEEEHQNEEGALSGLEGKNGISKGNVQNRVMKIKQTILEKYPKDSEEYQLAKTIKKTIFGQNQWPKGQKDEDGLFEELDVLYDYLQLQEEESTLKKQYNQEQKKLNQAVLAKYGNLSDEAIKTLVVEDKWLTDIRKAIEEEVNRLTQQLAGRIRELEERYAEPLPDIEEEVKDYSSKVQEHLKNMGVQ